MSPLQKKAKAADPSLNPALRAKKGGNSGGSTPAKAGKDTVLPANVVVRMCDKSDAVEGAVIESALHERMLSSPHRTVDGEHADYYYVPTYTSCAILPVYDWIGPGTPTGYPMRPVTAMRMAFDALQQVQ